MPQKIPLIQTPLTDANGGMSRPWYRYLKELDDGSSSDTQQLQSQINVINGKLDNLSDGWTLKANNSITQAGAATPGSVVLISLVNDQQSPAKTAYYGTDANGIKGWNTVASTLNGSANIVLTTDASGVTTFDLSEVTVGAGGALKKYGFDAYGRLSQEATATTDDLPQGTTNLYAPVIEAIASESLTYPMIVAIDGAGNAYYPDLTNAADLMNIAGVTLNAALAGASVKVTKTYLFTESAWNWFPGRVYCAQTGGALTQTPPSTGAIVEVGRVINPTTVLVDVQSIAIIL